MQTRERLKGIDTPDEVSVAIRHLIASQGEGRTMLKLGLSRQTMAPLAAGMSVNRATLECVRGRLAL